MTIYYRIYSKKILDEIEIEIELEHEGAKYKLALKLKEDEFESEEEWETQVENQLGYMPSDLFFHVNRDKSVAVATGHLPTIWPEDEPPDMPA